MGAAAGRGAPDRYLRLRKHQTFPGYYWHLELPTKTFWLLAGVAGRPAGPAGGEMTWNLYIFVAGLKARDFACCFRPSARQPVHLFAASFRVIFSAIILLSHAIPGFHFGAV